MALELQLPQSNTFSSLFIVDESVSDSLLKWKLSVAKLQSRYLACEIRIFNEVFCLLQETEL